jgi:cytoskeletal protein CcmA (bactofilin family)
MRARALTAALLVGLVVVVAGCVSVHPGGGSLVFEGSRTVRSGERVDGDLIVFSGSTTVEQGGVVDGDLVAFSGDVTVDGTVNGDVVAFGGGVTVDGRVDGDILSFSGAVRVNGTVDGDILAFAGPVVVGPEAHVTGDVGSLAGPVTQAPGARIEGSAGVMAVPRFAFLVPGWGAFFALLLGFLLRAIVPGLIAIVVAALWPARVVRMQRAAAREPAIAGILGVATQIVVITLCIGLMITICLIPFGLLGLLLLAVATWFGWTALGASVGERLRGSFGASWGPVATAGIGTWVLSFGVAVIELVPCLGWLVSLVLHGIALGVVVLTVFGKRDYPPTLPVAPTPAADGAVALARSDQAGGEV